MSTKKGKFDKAVSKGMGKKYDKRLKKNERSNLFHYVLRHLGLRK